MNYLETFKNLKTNSKYSRKSPHKAILLLTVIELYETNVLSENKILYDDMLKNTFRKVWESTLRGESLFQPEAYLPFWYMQNEDFWHVVPNRGKEDILFLLKDNHVKPSETKLKDCVKYAELDEDLFFLMTIPSGRSSLKRTLLETYTDLTEEQIDKQSQSVDNAIDYSASALSEYEKLLTNGKNITKAEVAETTDNELVHQFQMLNEELQIVLNIQYYSFLKSHRKEREMFKEVCPTVYDLLDKIVNHPIKRGEIVPSFAFTYDNFLSDLKISLMSEEGSMELIDKICEAIDELRGNTNYEYNCEPAEETKQEPLVDDKSLVLSPESEKGDTGSLEIKHVYLDSRGSIVDKNISKDAVIPERDFTKENRKGKAWTKEEEEQIEGYFQQGIDAKTIAAIIGRTEVAIKMRLAKLGLIEYAYDKESGSSSLVENGNQDDFSEKDFAIENSLTRCSILNKYGEKVFSSEGKLIYILGKLYRFNLKNECLTVKSMHFNGSIWLKGEKKIVAYPRTKLYQILDGEVDYSDKVEDIIDSSVFEYCKLKFNGVWYKYNGDLITDETNQDKKDDNNNQDNAGLSIIQSPLYAVRRQAILRAMGFFRKPATIKDLVRTISRTAWGAIIKEDDVEKIINTITEVESVEGKYILRSQVKQNGDKKSYSPNPSFGIASIPKKKTKAIVGSWIHWTPAGVVGKVIGFVFSGGIQKIVIQMKDGSRMEVFDNPNAYDVILGKS